MMFWLLGHCFVEQTLEPKVWKHLYYIWLLVILTNTPNPVFRSELSFVTSKEMFGFSQNDLFSFIFSHVSVVSSSGLIKELLSMLRSCWGHNNLTDKEGGGTDEAAIPAGLHFGLVLKSKHKKCLGISLRIVAAGHGRCKGITLMYGLSQSKCSMWMNYLWIQYLWLQLLPHITTSRPEWPTQESTLIMLDLI